MTTTTHSCLRFILIGAQVFGMFPVSGVTNRDATSLKFKWTSKRTIYSIIFALAAALNSLIFFVHRVSSGRLEFSEWVKLLLFLVTVCTVVLLLDIAKKWPSLMKKWTQVDEAMSWYGFPPKLQRKLRIIFAITVFASLVEHGLFIGVEYISCRGNSSNLTEALDRYFKFHYDYVFAFVPYYTVLGIILEILNIFSTISWTFMDLFIILISLSLSARFKQVAKHINYLVERNVMNENSWQKTRKDYNGLTKLCKDLDEIISSIILLSFGNNIFIILVHLFNSLWQPPRFGYLDEIYYLYSFICLLVRISAVALHASTINTESKRPIHVLNMIPYNLYNVEIDRLLLCTKYETAALTGYNLFRITRTLILKITMAIITYELLLVEYLKVKIN
ncbi:gustatory receptor for sugar taste 64e-like [Tribolium madens]|uniref:gustatory receptor for sugar taste 64e-like n=1 Tax=Tribolium madens TaxID=41895 RepID=UPI001CF757F7|nr:gustatory receptor for sugar taste 64e-like [Tribolium madens]